MGVDLRLLVCEHWILTDNGTVWGYSHTILDLGGVSYEVRQDFEVRVKPYLEPMPAKHNIASFIGSKKTPQSEPTYGTIREKDAYGTPFMCVSARHLLPWLVEHFKYDGQAGHGPFQASIVAYVRALPAYTKIVLDWH